MSRLPEMSSTEAQLCKLLDLVDGQVVTFIGAGGKHTLMDFVAQELAGQGRSAVLTSTTNLHRNRQYAKLPLLQTELTDPWSGPLAELLSRERRAVVVSRPLADNLYRGIGADQIGQVAAAVPQAVLLVKADGARKRLLKVPADHEPVFPPVVDVCVLILSLAAIGKKLTETYVHRLALVRALTGGETVTVQTLVDVIVGPGGYGDRLPPSARNVLYLSCCDGPEALAAARRVAKATHRLFHRQICGDTIRRSFLVLDDPTFRARWQACPKPLS